MQQLGPLVSTPVHQSKTRLERALQHNYQIYWEMWLCPWSNGHAIGREFALNTELWKFPDRKVSGPESFRTGKFPERFLMIPRLGQMP
jgi:hypothetical protein